MLTLLIGLCVFCYIYCHQKTNEFFTNFQLQHPTELVLINMDSRKDRLDNFTQHYQASDCVGKLPMYRLQAVVGKEIDWKSGNLLSAKGKKTLENVITKGKRESHDDLSIGAVGCYLSHLKAMEYVVSKNKPMIICEDDAVLPVDFFNRVQTALLLPVVDSDNVVILFHILCKGWDKLKCIQKQDNFFEVYKFWSMASYYITPTAAKLILEKTQPIEVQIDAALSEMATNGDIRIYAHSIVDAGFMGTDIQMPLE
jgi:GR25 family glycosyltransferase involved in LPS biosynthesis